MAVEYANRKGDRYYLQSGKTRLGKPRYYFGRKLTGTPVDQVPQGFEIYESPGNAQVFLRKCKPTDIREEEWEMLCEAIRRDAGLRHFAVEVEGNSLVVYLPDTGESEAAKTVEIMGGISLAGSARAAGATEWLVRRSTYSKMMRFDLVDTESRVFTVQRWCFRGSIDGWFRLRGRAALSELAGRYVRHLGKESFFELM